MKILKYIRENKVYIILVSILNSKLLSRWVYSTNHKDIATLYFLFGIFSAIVGGFHSYLIRTELAEPGSQTLSGNSQLYNTIVTSHGLIMISFAAMPIMIGGFGN